MSKREVVMRKVGFTPVSVNMPQKFTVKKTRSTYTVVGETKNRDIKHTNISDFIVKISGSTHANSRKVISELNKRLERWCKIVTPVSSGQLRKSLTARISDFTVSGNNEKINWNISVIIESDDPKARFKTQATRRSPGRYVPILNRRLTAGRDRGRRGDSEFKIGEKSKQRKASGINIGEHPGTKAIPYDKHIRRGFNKGFITTRDILEGVRDIVMENLQNNMKQQMRV